MKLYSYYRSSAAYRVRIALALKGLAYELQPVDLLRGEQREADYLEINPQGLVPALETDDGRVISQSSAILEWLEETYDDTPLLPADPYERALVRAFVNTIACDIHPLNNLRVLQYLKGELDQEAGARNDWYHHWIRLGFASLEQRLSPAPYCFGDRPGMADVYLVPQVFNALRFDMEIDAFPGICAVYTECNELDTFISAAPANQPDAPNASP